MRPKPILILLAMVLTGNCYSQYTGPDHKQIEWLQGSWKGLYNNAPFYEAWRKVNDSVFVNFKIEIKGTDTVVSENGAILLFTRFRGFRGGNDAWTLDSLANERIVLKNDTLKYANRIIWWHSANDHWLTEIHNPGGGVIYYDLERVPWLDGVVNRFIQKTEKQ